MIDLDGLIREADPARDVVIPPGDPSKITSVAAGSPRRRSRVFDGLAVGSAGAVALGVALVVLLTGGQAPVRSTSRPYSVPAAARPLVRILGVLRRSPSAADRAAGSTFRGGHIDANLVRVVALTRWKEQLELVPSLTKPATLSLSTLTNQHGREMTIGFGAYTASQIEQGKAWVRDDFGPFDPRHGIRLVIVVPDGVARVAFVRADGHAVTVPVHDNVAFARITDFCCGANLKTRWYAPDGRLIKVTFANPNGTSELGPPAINLPPGTITVARLRDPDGKPFRLTLQRIRFVGHNYLCLAVVQRGTGQSCENPLPLPDRPLVVFTNFPVVCKPHPAQLVWGLALSDVSVAVRAGGRDERATRKSIPAALHVPGSLFYVWAGSASTDLVARSPAGRIVETLPINSKGVPTPAAICAGR